MKLFVFDIDDTLIIHTPHGTDYYRNRGDTNLQSLIRGSVSDVNYIYTNGTYGHAENVLQALNLEKDIQKSYARDTIPHMKPHPGSFKYVHNDIRNSLPRGNHQIFFFDDNLDNLWAAKFFGWNTIWITPSSQEIHDFVDATYPNIFEALLRFQKKN